MKNHKQLFVTLIIDLLGISLLLMLLASSLASSAGNTAPVLDNSGQPQFDLAFQDEFNPAGTLVSQMLATGAGGDPISDPDLGAVEGIAVTAVDNANGVWQFSTNGGVSWTNFPTNTYAASLDLNTLTGGSGLTINGSSVDDQAGWSISNAGDVNGDGRDDLIIGANQADPHGQSNAGAGYVIFGTNQGLSTLDLSSLDGGNGFALTGVIAGDFAGHAVSGAGDINHDGYADVIISAFQASPTGRKGAGAVYVVFGGGSFPASLDLGSLDGSNGFMLKGVNREEDDDKAGYSVSGAGDVNGDNIDDIIIGAPFADPLGSSDGLYDTGQSYVVFGSGSAFPASLDLGSLDGSSGFAINGVAQSDWAGHSVSRAGDVNGDGYAEVVIGAMGADPNGLDEAGAAYLLFGRSSFPAALNLSTLDGSNGLSLEGGAAWDKAGWSVSGAGDINGDGLADVLVSAAEADNVLTDTGKSYVVFGRRQPFSATLALSALDGSDGFALNGIGAGDFSGQAVSGAGDLNSDGLADLFIGANKADPNGRTDAGESYILFGSQTSFPAALDLSNLDGLNGVVVKGAANNDQAGYSVSGGGDFDGDGLPDLFIGAPHSSAAAANGGRGFVVFGRPAVTTLADTAKIRFVPRPGFAGSAWLLFRAWDTTDGHASGDTGVQIAGAGGSFAYSSALEQASITVLPPPPDLALAQTFEPTGLLLPGQTITYTLSFSNSGAATAYNVVLTNVIPAALGNLAVTHSGVTITPTGSQRYVWQIGDLPVGDGGTIVVTGEISPDLTADVSFTNAATIDGSDPEANTANNSVSKLTNVALPRVYFESAGYSVAEIAGTAAITARLNIASSLGVSVDYATADGTATAGSDYSAVSGTLTFSPNTKVQTFSVPILDDWLDEGHETIALSLSNANRAVLDSPSQATLTIINDDQTITGLQARNSSPTALGGSTAFTATVTAGNDVSYVWDFGDGATGSGAKAVHTYNAAGSYTAVVTATNAVNEVTATTSVTIRAAVAGLAATNNGPVRLGQAATMTATITAGDGVTYSWDFGDGQKGSGPAAAHTYTAVGSYIATVTAGNGVSSQTAQTTISVLDVPLSGLQATNNGPKPMGQPVNLAATVATGSNVVYAWDFGDSTTGSGASVNHTYPTQVGVYTATVTASNSVGALTATTVVSVTDIPITGLAISSNSPRILGQGLDLAATVTAGSNVGYVWDLGDGSGPVSGSSVSAYLYAAPGSYTVVVTATNGLGSQVKNAVVTISPRTCWVRLNDDPADYFYVQSAVDASASSGDVVKVAGTCTGVSTITSLNSNNPPFVARQVVALTKNLTLRGGYTATNWSTYDPVANPTTLDAQGQGRVLYVTNGVAPLIEGLTLTGGNAVGLGGSAVGHIGGGVFVKNANPTFVNNTISNNTADQGGGMWLLQSSAVISHNTISGNSAPAVDGGGLYLYQGAPTVIDNAISGNSAGRYGGGVYLYQGAARFETNLVSGNSAQDGAGLYSWNSTANISSNSFTSNSASASGGGLYLFANAASIRKNLFQGNQAQHGGGLYLYSDQTDLDGNTVSGNRATANGGGLYLNKSNAILANTFVISNRAVSYGSGFYILAAQPKIYHATIASNNLGDGVGIYVQGEGTRKSNVQVKNSILVDHTIGIQVEATNQASLEATLWGSGSWANGSNWAGGGAISTGSVNILAEPGFANPAGGDYHLTEGSAALDQGVTDAGVITDFDGYKRPSGGGYDLGADELPIALNVLHTATPNPATPGAELTYTLLVTNADSISAPVTIVFTPPAGVTPHQAQTWNVTLLAGNSWTTQLTATVANVAGGFQTSSLQVTDSGGETITNNFSLEVQHPISGLTLSNDGPTPWGDITTMTASASGDSISYAWNFGDGQLASGAVVTNIYASVGSYTVVVTAGNGVDSATAAMTVIVEKKVSGLTLTASSPVTKNLAIPLSAAVGQGSNVTYLWDFGDGQSGSGAAINHAYDAIGTYTVVVTASNQVSLVTKTVSIEVQEAITGLWAGNDGPTALNQSTTLSATIAAGNKVSYSWDFGDGQSGSGAVASHQYNAVGSYVATVTASNGVSSQQQTTTVIVTDIPVTGLTAGNNGPTELNAVTTLSANVGTGSNVSYAWSFGDGQTGSGATVFHKYGATGSYTATVIASNATSAQTATTLVTVVDQPIGGLTFGSSSPDNLGETTTFAASINAGTSVIYTWDFGDGGVGSGQNPGHTYNAGGSFTVTLTAANSVGSAVASGLVTINWPPAAILSLSAYTGTLDTPITADASGSSDPEGGSLSYTFDFGGERTVGPQSSPTATHTFVNGGAFTVRVTVSDGQLSSSASQTVDIKRTPKLAIDKQGPALAYAGDLITYTLTITNLTLPPGSSPDAILQVTPTRLNFSATEGGSNPANQSFFISNGGTGALDWLIEENASWLTLNSTAGSGPASVSVAVDISGLSVGVYTEKIIVDAGAAQNGLQEVEATLTLFCSGRQPVDVVLALDKSGSMYGAPFTDAREAVKKFVSLMDLNTDQVGLVSFNDIATVNHILTQDGAAVQATVDGLYANGMTDIAEAINDAHSELMSARRNPANSPVMILLSDGTQTVVGDPLAEAAQAKADGIRIISIGLGWADTSTLKAVASGPDDYYYAPSAADLSAIYNRIAVAVGCPGAAGSSAWLDLQASQSLDPLAPRFRTFATAATAVTPDTATATNLVISDTLPVGATYVGGGALQGNVVTWTIPELKANASVQVSFVVTADKTIVNDDYGVSANDGFAASGNKPVTTMIQPRPIPPTPQITLSMQPSETSIQGAQTVVYHYLATNSGPVTLTNIAIDDSRLGFIGGIETLRPNETLTLQQSAMIIEQTTSLATVTAESAYGPVSDTASATVNFVPVVPCGATIQSVGDGDWKDASTWSPARIPTSSDIVLVNAGHTVIIQASARTNIQALCNYGVLRSTDKQQLHIDAHDFLFNYGTIESTAGEGGPDRTCGHPANDLKLDGRPIINWGVILAGDGGDGDKCGGRGGSVMVRGLNTTNYGAICAGKGGDILGSSAGQKGHSGKGGDTSVWGNHGGPGMLLNTGLICAGDGGAGNPAASGEQRGGDGGDLRLISEPDVILSGGRYYAGDGGLGSGGGRNGKDGRVFIEPTIIALAGPNTEVKGGDIIIFGGDDWVLDLSNMNGAAIKASGSITLAVGSGGTVDLRHNGSGSDVLQAGGQVFIAADTIEIDSGASLAEVVGDQVVTGPAQRLKDVALSAAPLVEALPGATLPISLTVMNGGPDDDRYILSQQNRANWTINHLPASVDIVGLDLSDLALSIDVPETAQIGEQNSITFTAQSASDPTLVTTIVVEVEVTGAASGGSSVYLPLVIK